VLKELIRLHTAASQPEAAARFKQLYRLSLTQREILGTGMLLLLASEWGATCAQSPKSGREGGGGMQT
jgi:hypothetical protein